MKRFRESEGVRGVSLFGPIPDNFGEILTAEALEFVAKVSRRFSGKRVDLLRMRTEIQRKLDDGWAPDFPSETRWVREADWKVSSAPVDLHKRHVEITGPAGDRKMVINALNSGADVYMSDFEDSQSPTWSATIQGQINLRDAVEGTISYTSPEGKEYRLAQKTSTLVVRPRGWHLLERHVHVDDEPISASLFDFSLYLFHNTRKLLAKGTGPYFYLPKLEGYEEARLWNEVFDFAEDEIGIRRGTIKATVLIETILAGFQMDEILYELREHSTGLNCGRWDYMFSFIKKFRNRPDMILPDRAQLTMDKGFLASYVSLSVKTCHRRGAHSIGGMSAYIPVKDEVANETAFRKVKEDKEREVRAGHDGTWVAHPGLVRLAADVFAKIGGPHQISNRRDDVSPNPGALLAIPAGEVTLEGVRTNVSVGLQYLEAWLRGRGSVPLYNLMEDSATAEICRSQLWQWCKYSAKLKEGGVVTRELFQSLLNEELKRHRHNLGDEGYRESRFEQAASLIGDLVMAEAFPEFLTTSGYDGLISLENASAENP